MIRKLLKQITVVLCVATLFPKGYQVCQSCIDAATNVTHKKSKREFLIYYLISKRRKGQKI